MGLWEKGKSLEKSPARRRKFWDQGINGKGPCEHARQEQEKIKEKGTGWRGKMTLFLTGVGGDGNLGLGTGELHWNALG